MFTTISIVDMSLKETTGRATDYIKLKSETNLIKTSNLSDGK